MGAVLGVCSLASWVPCLCGGASCLLCGCCPNSKNSTVTRLIYASILILGTVVSCIMQTEGVKNQLKKIPGFCEGGFKIKVADIKADTDCNVQVGFKAVYRISFALAIFFFAFSLLMLKVKTSKDPRAAIHNGFWFFKIAAIVGIMVGSFYIPGGYFTTVLLSVTSILYIASILFVSLLYIYYTKPDGCTENKFFISINLILCVVVSIISIHPKIQEHHPRSGLLQSSIITLYTIYLTWSALTNEPDHSCNPSLWSIITHLTAPTLAPANSTALVPTSAPPTQSGHLLETGNFIGLLTLVLCLVYSSFRTSTNSQVSKLTLSGSESVILRETTTNGANDEEEGQPRRAVDNEKEGVQYSYAMFHLMLCLASLYIMMTVTGWYSPDAEFQNVTSKWPAVWVKISSSWVCLLLYAWSLVAPVVLTNRDFS
ncbi:serine incorporator 3 isoform X2 [Myotis daubentonii]|uniref:serine incorporator 3 isoform X2 n=1 Tax=Myotis daubentonii TaxID=98922 RepID=UPI0028738811|nr:serine incorporator 3 isoform X2 [Myotis daubentonii]